MGAGLPGTDRNRRSRLYRFARLATRLRSSIREPFSLRTRRPAPMRTCRARQVHIEFKQQSWWSSFELDKKDHPGEGLSGADSTEPATPFETVREDSSKYYQAQDDLLAI